MTLYRFSLGFEELVGETERFSEVPNGVIVMLLS